MKRIRNRFDWIARGWIAIGFFDVLFVFMFYCLNVIFSDDDYLIVIHFCGFAGMIYCVALIISGFLVIDRKWLRVYIPGALALVWGIIQCGTAIVWMAILYRRNSPPADGEYFILIGFPAVGSFLVLSGLYFILTPDVYLQDRSRRLATRASHGASEAQPAS